MSDNEGLSDDILKDLLLDVSNLDVKIDDSIINTIAMDSEETGIFSKPSEISKKLGNRGVIPNELTRIVKPPKEKKVSAEKPAEENIQNNSELSKEKPKQDKAKDKEQEEVNKPIEEKVIENSRQIAPIENNPGNVLSTNVNNGGILSTVLADPLKNDLLYNKIKKNESANVVYNTIMQEIAEEAAYLKAWRAEHWLKGEDVSDVTLKRIKMLKSLVETLVEHEKLKSNNTTGKVDFGGEAFTRVLKYILEVIQDTFKEVNVPEQYEDIFFSALAKSFVNFEKTAERLYYNKGK